MVRETHSPSMEGFRFPSKDSQPLQQLSPQRVNSTWTSTTVSTTTKQSIDCELSPAPSPQSSPSRRAKANLFADYDPNRGSPTKGSLMLGGGGIPQSPSLPEITALRNHGRTNSDVQGLVKRFEHLDVRDRDAESAERIKRREAELRRALMAREEAETDAKRLRAEIRKLEGLADEGMEREKIVARRVEVLMEQLASAKEAHTSQSAVYEKEIRKARKEAFKTSSFVVKLQEELKATRSALRVAQQDREMEMQRSQQKEQERFEMEYQLVPLHEELSKLERHLQVAQEETLALKASLKEEEMARIAAEGRIALPPSQDVTDEFASPGKQSSMKRSPMKRVPSPLSDDKENVRSARKKTAESRRVAEELEREKMRREHAEELAEFLQIECNFRCCGCKRSSSLGHKLSMSLDDALAEGVARIREDMQSILSPLASVEGHDAMDVDPERNGDAEGVAEEDRRAEVHIESQPTEELMERTDFAPTEGKEETIDGIMTFAAESPRLHPAAAQQQPQQQDAEPDSTPYVDSNLTTATTTVPLHPSTPPRNGSQIYHDTTPFRHPSVRTVTTTTTVPMQFTPASKAAGLPLEDAENIPPPQGAAFDRAAALAAIEYRRGRAKSLANGTATPRKQMMEGVVGGRRDISAPALGQKSGNVGAGAAKRIVTASVGRAQGRRMG